MYEHLDGPWIAGLARARGLRLSQERAARIAAQVAPTLTSFRALAASLSVDDDMYEFRRLLRETIP